MQALTVYVDVPNLAETAGPKGHFRRVSGLLDDRKTLVVATMTAGSTTADTELTFSLADAAALADAALSGDRRALTTPGLARILSATVATLFRVSLAAGAIEKTEEIDDGRGADLSHDRNQTQGTGHAGD